jgi:anaerobic selenocysteine-containing dehydrogenase
VRTGYSAIADEWIPIKPGTDGALLLALIHELIRLGLYDREFLARYTNAGQLVNQDPASDEFGMMLRKADGDIVNPLRPAQLLLVGPPDRAGGGRPHRRGRSGLLGHFKLPDGTPAVPAFQLLEERVKAYTPEWAEGITGIPAATIRRLAHEMGITARDQKIELPIAWTDSWGKRHDFVTGNPVAFHAMRGLAAHSNGFQTIRSLAILMSCWAPSTARRISAQGALPARRAAERPPAQGSPGGQAGHPAGRRTAGLARESGRSVCGRSAGSRCASTRASPGSTRCRPTA